ncbi:MAG: Uma2 family endonuclease [Phormidesmis sp. CAN_BIN36]|nr:Uma2 family endonuclease [Phormidesmis sp. CAN_BIN36]
MNLKIALRQISVQDYHQMAEAGILLPDEQIELLEGQIIKMAAKGTAHRAAVSRINHLLENQLGDRVLICLQDPIRLDDYSEPEPDVAVVRPDPLYYEDHHPTPAEIFLLIEVADTSLKFDCETKALAYARSGIVEYWVLDVNDRKLHVYLMPSATGYQSETILSEALTVSPLAFPECVIAIKALLRSPNVSEKESLS